MIDFTGCEIIQYPSGRWGFVGRVPAKFGWLNMDGSLLTDEQAAEVVTLNLPAMKYKSRSFETKEAAEKAATMENNDEEKFRDLPGGYRALVGRATTGLDDNLDPIYSGKFVTTIINMKTKEAYPGTSGKTAKEALDAAEAKYANAGTD